MNYNISIEIKYAKIDRINRNCCSEKVWIVGSTHPTFLFEFTAIACKIREKCTSELLDISVDKLPQNINCE
jgi:hypothetical protein